MNDDFIAEGWHVVDEKYLNTKAPKIKWGRKYLEWSDGKKIKYLEELSCSMNHALSLIQEERDELNRLCFIKEEQLTILNKSIQQNNDMVQKEITRMNEQRQDFNTVVATLNKEIRELRNGNHN